MRAALAALAVLLAGTAQAKEPWVTAEGPGIAAARFEVADTSYPHRIMGRIPERRVLAARDAAGRETRLDPRRGPEPSHVFEDISPRLVEADGDGATDAVVVESSPEVGAQLAIYSLRRGALVKSAATPPIGTPFRWLAPAAIGDLNGDGITDIACVETPHLRKVLCIWSWAPGGLTEIAQLDSVTNHRIGDEVIWGGLHDCGSAPEIVLAVAGFRRLVAVAFAGDGLAARPLGLDADQAGFDRALACE